MKRVIAASALILIGLPGLLCADMLGNPGNQVGRKNLVVGAEFSAITQTYDIDTTDLDLASERANLKVTTGLTDWLDVFVKVGAGDLIMKYKENNYSYNALGYAVSNYESDMNVGFGGGGRLRLINRVDSGFRIFVQGGAYYFKTNGEISWKTDAVTTFTKERDTKWLDLYAGIGAAKRIDYIDLHVGVGISQVHWWIQDTDVTKVGSSESRFIRPERDSWESMNPLFGFFGVDFVLPHEYRLSIQAGVRNMDNAEFSVAISQGLERE
jgi:hypothetical protein